MPRYFRLGIKGRLGAAEVWSVNPVVDPANEITVTWDQEAGDAATQGIAGITVPDRILLALSNAGSITSIRLEMRDTANTDILGVSEYSLPTPIIGTGLPSCPPQNSIVSSLRTTNPLRSGRGRLYWPAPGVGITSSSFKLDATFVQDFADGVSSYLTAICNEIRTAFSAGPTVSVGISVYSPTKGTLTPVNRIQVGDVLDTQRRRRDSLPETYKSAVFPTP